MATWKKTFTSAFIAQIFSIVGFSFGFPFIPFFIRDLGVDKIEDQTFWAGVVMASTGVTLAIFSPIWGVLADKFGRKSMVIRAMFGGAVVVILISYVQNVPQLIICRLLQGMFTGTVSASVALVASVTPEERSGFTLGMMQTAVFIGMAVGPLLGGFVADEWGYRIAFRIGSVILLAGGLLVLFGTEEHFDKQAKKKRDESRQSFMEIFLSSGFIVGVFILFALRFSNTASNPSFPLIVRDILGDTPRLNSITGSIIFSVAVAGAISAAILGHFSDKWGHKKVLLFCSIAGAVISFAHFFAYSIPYLVVVRTMFGFAVAGMIPAANVIIKNSIHDSNLGKGFGLAGSLSFGAFALGPLLGGWVGREMGLRVPFIITSSGLATVVITVLFFIKTPTSKTQKKTAA